jgi:pimeloyl-ACP methyl ester carboxylesterase
MMNHLKLALILLSSTLTLSCDKVDLKETTIDLSSHKLTTFSIIKNSKYLVVFESGLADDHSVWNKKDILPKISKVADVLLYDRAGIGKSETGPTKRNIERLSSELSAVINKFSNDRKVILVGHSLGGLIIRDYAIKNPEKTAAILFVEPTHEFYNHFSQSTEDAICSSIKSYSGPKSGGVDEARELIEDLQYASTLPDLPNVPIIVLTSMKQNADNIASDKLNGSSRQVHYDAHELLRNGVTDFTHITTTNSGHYIIYEEPNLVTDNIKLLISKLK